MRIYLYCSACMFTLVSPAMASIFGFGDFTQFMINQADGGSAPTITVAANSIDSSIRLTNVAAGEIRSIFSKTPQDISNPFVASFTYRNSNGNQAVYGAAFVIQNSPAGPAALSGNCCSSLGYAGITKSAAISLELFISESRSGLYTNGNVSGGATNISPLNLLSGHEFDVALSYNGSLLQQSITDKTTLQNYAADYPLNLTSLMGGTTAYVGFTATTNGGADQYSSRFTFGVPEPSTATLLLAGSIVLFRRHRHG